MSHLLWFLLPVLPVFALVVLVVVGLCRSASVGDRALSLAVEPLSLHRCDLCGEWQVAADLQPLDLLEEFGALLAICADEQACAAARRFAAAERDLDIEAFSSSADIPF